MAQNVKVWYDAEGDFVEVLLSNEPGYMRATNEDSVMERVDQKGRLLGFSIMNVSRLRGQGPVNAQLAGRISGLNAA
jgi:hypothetical protein